MNGFDAAVLLVLLVAIVAGFRSGLLRSMATIFGYLIAMALAVAATPWAVALLSVPFSAPSNQTWLVFCGLFLGAGILLSALLRAAVDAIVGPSVSVPDRIAGAMLGAGRIVLLAVLLVLIFDRIIPPNLDPAFLKDSRLRPILSRAGQQGLRTLPPDVNALIDRLKRLQGL